MTVATDLQDLVADVSTAIAERSVWSRAELEVLRRNLTAAATGAGRALRDAERARSALEELCAGVDSGAVNITGLAARARSQVSA